MSARALLLLAAVVCGRVAAAQLPADAPPTHAVTVGTGWARSSVSTVIFRTSSVVTHGTVQDTAYDDDSARVVLARRRLGTDRWDVRTTSYTNEATDAHNAIAIAVDGRGVLHVCSFSSSGRGMFDKRVTQARTPFMSER